MLVLTDEQWKLMVAEAWRTYPLECSGLLVGPTTAVSSEVDNGAPDIAVSRFVAIENAAKSSKIYMLEGSSFARAVGAADDEGRDIVGVVHSHTHTAAYPSPTDVAEARKPLVPPNWVWLIISLGWGYPEVRAFRIGQEDSAQGIHEIPIRLEP